MIVLKTTRLTSDSQSDANFSKLTFVLKQLSFKIKTIRAWTGIVFYFSYCWIFKIFFTFFLLPTIIVVSYWQSTNQIWTSVENIKMQKSQKTWVQRIFLLTFSVWFLLFCLMIHSQHPLIIYDGVGTDDGPSKDETSSSVTRIDWIVKIAR